jgi:uncharacterized membrane protein
VIACVFGVGFAFILPPLAGADEGVHFLRAWNVSNGHVFAQSGHRAGDPAPDLGAYVPSGLEHGLQQLLIAGELDPHNARKVWSHLGDAAPAGRPEFVDFAAAAVYPPVPYLPSAIGIRIGRLFGASPFVLVLLARLADLAAFIALVALAIRRLPTRAWVLTILALTPVALFQASAVSADAITTALALVVVADAFALMARPVNDVPKALLIETVLATLALSLSKQPYVLAAALLLLPAWRHRRAIGGAIVGALAVGGVLVLSWAHWANDHYLAPNFLPPRFGTERNYANNNVQPSAQTSYLRSHPFAFVRAVGRMITDHGVSIAHDVVAQTSFWRVPGVIAVLIALGVLAIVVIDAAPLAGGNPMRAVALGLAAFTTVVSLVLAYIGWNSLRAPRIDGFQGRYLLLVFALIALVIRPDGKGPPRFDVQRAGLWLAGWSAVLLLAVEIGLAWHSYS